MTFNAMGLYPGIGGRTTESSKELGGGAELGKAQVGATTQVAHDRGETGERQFGPGETARHDLPPLRHRFAAYGVHASRFIGGEQVAVAVVLVLGAPRVLPVIEDLAAENVAADAP